jgi:outer membrane protein
MRLTPVLFLVFVACAFADNGTNDLVTSTSTPTASAPMFGTGAWYRKTFQTDLSPRVELKPPVHLDDYVVGGKLELSLRSYIELVLANNTDVAITRLTVETSRNNILRQYSIFDPLAFANFNATRALSPTDGDTATYSSLTQPLNFGYGQTLPTGTSYSIGYSATKTSNNGAYDLAGTYNPYTTSNMTLAFAQPLLRGRGSYVTKLPITIARSRLKADEYGILNQLLTLVSSAESAYWDVIQARENVRVQEQALALSDASLKRAQRELELGAISSLDIYQPEAQYQNYKILLVQAKYQLQQTEDVLRTKISADLDPAIRALPIVLTETIERQSEPAFDREQLVEKALRLRPDINQQRQFIDVDDLGIRSAANALKPSLALTGQYGGFGRSGTYFDGNGLTSGGGFSDSAGQMFGFGYPSYGFGLSLQLPIRDRRASADYADAVVGKRLDALRVRSFEQNARQSVLNAISRAESTRASVELAKVALDFAQKRVDAEQKKYDLGVSTLFFLLDAQSALNRAQSDLVNQSVNYRKDLLNLQRITGELLAERNITIQ